MSNTDTSASARLRQIKAHTLSIYHQNNPRANEGGPAKTADASVTTSRAPGFFPIKIQVESKFIDETCVDCVSVIPMLEPMEPIAPMAMLEPMEPIAPMAMLEPMEPIAPMAMSVILTDTETIENLQETYAVLELPISTVEQKYLKTIEVSQRIIGIPKYVVRYPIVHAYSQSTPRRFMNNYRMITRRGMLVQAA